MNYELVDWMIDLSLDPELEFRFRIALTGTEMNKGWFKIFMQVGNILVMDVGIVGGLKASRYVAYRFSSISGN